MKIRQSFEQAICILLLISKSEGPLKSHDLSEKLHVSDSYLKKITRQLVVSGLITSKASKLGGFVLNKDPKDISFLDIFNAIEGTEHFIETTHLVEKVFDVDAPVFAVEEYIVNYLNQAEEQYRRKLKEITLDSVRQLVYQGNFKK